MAAAAGMQNVGIAEMSDADLSKALMQGSARKAGKQDVEIAGMSAAELREVHGGLCMQGHRDAGLGADGA
jgi:hypothetical protein